jgi:hypothetical protein
MRDLSDFERGQMIGAFLAGASVTKTTILLSASRATVLRLCRQTRIMGRQHQRRGTVGKINIDRKRSSYIEKDCFEKSHNCCCTGDRTAELNIHPEDLVSTKTV